MFEGAGDVWLHLWLSYNTKRIRINVILEGKWLQFLQLRYGIDGEDQIPFI